MKRLLVSGVCGVVFGLGMAISGMANPARVLAFFAVAGTFAPTLAFVMAGALMPMAIAWRIRRRLNKSVLGAELPGPASSVIDARLLGGAALFGAGWGIVGLCPGALVPALSLGGLEVLVHLGAVLVGMLVTRYIVSQPARLWSAGFAS